MTSDIAFELVTPAFSGQPRSGLPDEGFSGRCLKPLLRFWWRSFQDLPPRDLHEKESLVFGSEENGQRFTVRPNPFNDPWNRESRLEPNEHLDQTVHQLGDALLYLAYGTLARVPHSPSVSTVSPMFFSGRSVSFTLGYPDDCREEVEAAVWLFSVFGGWGRRSRRTFGSMRASGFFEIYPSLDASNTVQALEVLRNGTRLALKAATASRPKNQVLPRNIRHTLVSEASRFLAYPTVLTDARSAQTVLGEAFMRFRRSLGAYRRIAGTRETTPGSDHALRAVLAGKASVPGTVEPPKALAFGLPLNARMSSGCHVDFDCDSGRRASPLFMSVVKFGPEVYLPIIAYLPSIFLLRPDTVKVKKGISVPHPDWTRECVPFGNDGSIRDFLRELEAPVKTTHRFPAEAWVNLV